MENSSSNIKLRDYQIEAIDAWFNNDCRGIFEMATGTGKTFTALSCFKQLSDTKDRLLTVIACPQSHLIDQWINELKKFHNGPIITASGKNYKWKKDFKNLYADYYLGLVDKAVVLTTHISLSSDYFIDTIQEFEVEILLIVDEVHGIGSEKQMSALNNRYDYRLGLSATPARWFDDFGTHVIEEFFGGVVFEFDIERALNEFNPDTGKTYLTPYIYKPILVDLTNEEFEKYSNYSKRIAVMMEAGEEKDENGISLETYFFARQKIINNAEEKYKAFIDILEEKPDIDKLIVFCSPRQIDRVQEILNKKRIIPQHRFTQKQSATKKKKDLYSEREYLLYEREADVFARNLLSPAPLAYKVFYFSPREDACSNIQKVFGISYQAAETRLSAMDEDLNYYTGLMTQDCYRINMPFKKVCTACGTILEDNRKKCPYCCSTKSHYEFIDPDKPRRPTPKEMGFSSFEDLEKEARIEKMRKQHEETLLWLRQMEEAEEEKRRQKYRKLVY